MRLAQVIDSVNELKGGPSVVCQRLTQALTVSGHAVTVLANNYPEYGAALVPENEGALLFPSGMFTRYGAGSQRDMRRALLGPLGASFELIHSHGLWLAANSYARECAEKHGIPLVVSPRGMLEPWAMQRHPLRKKVVYALRERKNLQSAACIHVTSEQELASIRGHGLRQPVAVIPNGVDIPDLNQLAPRQSLYRIAPKLSDRPYILFLSRLHPKKGVDLLLPQMLEIRKIFPELHLLLAGQGTPAYLRQLRARVRALGLEDAVTFVGALQGSLKSAAFAYAEIFILPSYSENFGMVVAEALAHGTPVITTQETPWKGIQENHCGWWVACDALSLQNALQEAWRLSESERRAMGLRGRAYVIDKFAWSDVSAQMESVYSWLTYDTERPACVVL